MKVVLTPEDKARLAFDAENNVEPCRTIAERIVRKNPHPDDLVDYISYAIEDARALGKKRGAAEIERLRTALQDIAEDPYAVDGGAAEIARRALEPKP